LSQNFIETIPEIGQHMVGITREPMFRMNGGGRPTDQYSIRKDPLKSRSG
jgi:hypothetical protein